MAKSQDVGLKGHKKERGDVTGWGRGDKGLNEE